MSDNDKNEVPEVQARAGVDTMSGTRIIVDECPYCGRQHIHYSRQPYGRIGQRLADCNGGEYILVVGE